MPVSRGSPSLLLILLAVAFAVTLPFGRWRVHSRKFSLRWFLAIHAPIPLIFLMRVLGGFSYLTIPLFLASTVLGQVAGGRGDEKKGN